MKQIKIIFPVLLCAILLALSSCKETNADRLKAGAGIGKALQIDHLTVFESADGYKVIMQRRTRRGETRAETYQIIEKDGYLFIETEFSILVSYDSETDRILLSSGGEYVRSKRQSKN